MRPAFSVRDGSLRIGVWRHVKDMEGGRKYVSHSTRIDKRYFDKTAQEWRETAFLNKQDLATLHVMLPQVHDWIRVDIEQARGPVDIEPDTPSDTEPF